LPPRRVYQPRLADQLPSPAVPFAGSPGQDCYAPLTVRADAIVGHAAAGRPRVHSAGLVEVVRQEFQGERLKTAEALGLFPHHVPSFDNMHGHAISGIGLGFSSDGDF
jgi:hypothetical protein